jgi:hypothetical protein
VASSLTTDHISLQFISALWSLERASDLLFSEALVVSPSLLVQLLMKAEALQF